MSGNTMIIYIVRLVFLLVVLSLTLFYALKEDVVDEGATYFTMFIVFPAVVALGIVLVDMFWRRKPLHVIAGLFVGMLGGMGIGIVLGLVVPLVAEIFFPGTRDTPVVRLLQVLIGAGATFLGVTFVLQTKDDFRFVIPYMEFAREAKGAKPWLLDTSVIIDGRIADIAETRILESEIIIPRFVLAELQTIADSSDRLKRNRGRRGLDILHRLQSSEFVEMRIFDANVPEVERVNDVDAKLVALADHLVGRVVTNDYNLNKIAKLRGVEVININDLANALKPVALPGEPLTVKMVKPGEDAGQGVGYLDDGTMVVVEHGRDHIGREITLIVTSSLQTSAGRMIFGRIDPDRTFGHREKTPPKAGEPTT